MAIRSRLWMTAMAGLMLIPPAPAQTGHSSSVQIGIKDGCRMMVAVSINGQGPYDFLLDTGSSITLVDEGIACKLGLRPVTRLQLTTFIGARTMPMVWIREIRVGEELMNNIHALCFDLRKLYSFGYGIMGVLGQDFLSRFNYLISYRERMMTFDKDGSLKSSLAGKHLAVERNQAKFHVSVQPVVGGEKPLRFMLDSGAPEPVVFVKPSEAPSLDIVHMESNEVVAQTSVGRRTMRPCRIGTFRIDGLTLRNVRFMVAGLLPGEERYEDGLLPVSLFDAIYFNNEESYVILNPAWAK